MDRNTDRRLKLRDLQVFQAAAETGQHGQGGSSYGDNAAGCFIRDFRA